MKVGDTAARSLFFDIGLQWGDLSQKDRRTCKYVVTFVHKLPFGVPQGVEAIEVFALESIVNNFYQGIKRNADSVIENKGEHYERDLLASLSIPLLNLESFGCSKADVLIDQLVWLETCGKHTRNDAYFHCPKVEVEAFGQWMQNTLVKHEQ